MLFLFHIGAIKSERPWIQQQGDIKSFYSTLVRLKGKVHEGGEEEMAVSIPHWCD